MKKYPGFLLFATGLAIGCWIGRYGGTFLPAASNTPPTAVKMQREPRPVPPDDDAKWRSFGESVLGLSNDDQDAVVRELESGDAGAAIESLLAQAGPDGLRSDLKEMVTKLLAKWGTEDFDTAWKWAQSCKPEALKPFGVKLLLENLAIRDPEKALTLYEERRAISPLHESDFPDFLTKAAAEKGTEELIKLLNRFSYYGSEDTFLGRPRGISVNFAPDFDFRQVADETVKLMVKHEGANPDRFPGNFIEEWGKRDLRAAEDWVAKNPRLPFNEWSGLYEAAQTSLGTEAAGAWMAAKLDSAADGQKTEMLRNLINFSSADNIKAIAAVMPSVESRDRFLGDLIAASGGNYSENNTDTAMAMLSSPAARLAALRRMPRSNDWEPGDDELARLGITRAQWNEIFPPRE